jgi:hypothetical protein
MVLEKIEITTTKKIKISSIKKRIRALEKEYYQRSEHRKIVKVISIVEEFCYLKKGDQRKMVNDEHST